MKLKRIGIILLLSVAVLTGCNKDGALRENELGFAFKRCTKHDSAPKANPGDVIFGQMKILLNNKTQIFSNYGTPDRLFVIGENKEGSIDEFLMTLHIGDSAVMTAPADSMSKYVKDIQTRPEDKIYIYLTVSQIISHKELSGQEKETADKQKKEEENLTEYVLEHFERAEKKESGLFYLSLTEGSGKKAEYGKRLTVNYTVKDTAGNLYDTNIEQIARQYDVYKPRSVYKPFDFILGDDALIAGWAEGLSYMRAGGHCKLVVPSRLAYGEAGFMEIKPYTPLVFDIYLLKVEDAQ